VPESLGTLQLPEIEWIRLVANHDIRANWIGMGFRSTTGYEPSSLWDEEAGERGDGGRRDCR
jgi:hypothetical protein